jgi:hypothetical protein
MCKAPPAAAEGVCVDIVTAAYQLGVSTVLDLREKITKMRVAEARAGAV